MAKILTEEEHKTLISELDGYKSKVIYASEKLQQLLVYIGEFQEESDINVIDGEIRELLEVWELTHDK